MTQSGSCFHASFPGREGTFSILSYLQLIQPSSSPLHVPDKFYRLPRKEAKSSKSVLEALSLNHCQIWAGRRGLSCAPCLHSHECPERCQESGQLPASARSRSFTDMQHVAISTGSCTRWGPPPCSQQLQCHICSWKQPDPICGLSVFSFPTACGCMRQWQLEQPSSHLLLWGPSEANPLHLHKPARSWWHKPGDKARNLPAQGAHPQRVWANSCSISQFMLLDSEGVQDKKIPLDSSCLFPLFTCLSPLSLPVLWMSLTQSLFLWGTAAMAQMAKGESFLSCAHM